MGCGPCERAYWVVEVGSSGGTASPAPRGGACGILSPASVPSPGPAAASTGSRARPSLPPPPPRTAGPPPPPPDPPRPCTDAAALLRGARRRRRLRGLPRVGAAAPERQRRVLPPAGPSTWRPLHQPPGHVLSLPRLCAGQPGRHIASHRDPRASDLVTAAPRGMRRPARRPSRRPPPPPSRPSRPRPRRRPGRRPRRPRRRPAPPPDAAATVLCTSFVQNATRARVPPPAAPRRRRQRGGDATRVVHPSAAAPTLQRTCAGAERTPSRSSSPTATAGRVWRAAWPAPGLGSLPRLLPACSPSSRRRNCLAVGAPPPAAPPAPGAARRGRPAPPRAPPPPPRRAPECAAAAHPPRGAHRRRRVGLRRRVRRRRPHSLYAFARWATTASRRARPASPPRSRGRPRPDPAVAAAAAAAAPLLLPCADVTTVDGKPALTAMPGCWYYVDSPQVRTRTARSTTASLRCGAVPACGGCSAPSAPPGPPPRPAPRRRRLPATGAAAAARPLPPACPPPPRSMPRTDVDGWADARRRRAGAGGW